MQLRKKTVYFQYHLNCQYIHDISGDIEIELVQRNQNTVSSHFCFKTCQFTVNRWDLELILMQLRKKTVYFQYHLNCQYIHDISGDIDIGQVKEIRTLSRLISASNLVNLMSIDGIWSLVLCN